MEKGTKMVHMTTSKQTRIWIDTEPLDKLVLKYPEMKRKTYTGRANWAIHKLAENEA